MEDRLIAKVDKVEKLKSYDVTFKDGSQAKRERLQIKTRVDVYDDLLEEFDQEDRFFTFWGDQAVRASKELKEGGYVYIKDVREKELPPTEQYTESLITYNVKQFSALTKEKAAKVKAKLAAMVEAQRELADGTTGF